MFARLFIASAAIAACIAPALADPARLAGREWRVIAVAGSRLPAGTRVSLAFQPDGRVSGRSGCNRFAGKATVGNDAITFGPLASTRMACPPPLMQLETSVLAVLGSARTWTIERGRLTISATDGRTIEARRAPRQR